MKKEYKKPAMQVITVTGNKIVCNSGTAAVA